MLPTLRGALVVYQQLGDGPIRDPVLLRHDAGRAVEPGADVAQIGNLASNKGGALVKGEGWAMHRYSFGVDQLPHGVVLRSFASRRAA